MIRLRAKDYYKGIVEQKMRITCVVAFDVIYWYDAFTIALVATDITILIYACIRLIVFALSLIHI